MNTDLIQIEPQVARGKFDESLWNNPEYIAEEKLDGERFKMHIGRLINRFDSRVISKKTGKFTEKTDNIPHLRNFVFNELDGTILDGEIKWGHTSMSTSSIMGCLPEEAIRKQKESGVYAIYHIFDIIKYKGRLVTDWTYLARRAVLLDIFELHLRFNAHIRLVASIKEDKKRYCESTWATGGEGIILKNVNAPYTSKSAWVKVKKEKTFDVVIMGYKDPKELSIKKGDDVATATKYAERGWIGAVKFGQFVDGKLTMLGYTSGMPDEVRQMFSENKKKYIGSVITIEAQMRIQKSGKFRHPRMATGYSVPRKDKMAKDCIFSKNEA
jgi:ATP-dependent DNA ligase